jgi:hypothetical protein
LAGQSKQHEVQAVALREDLQAKAKSELEQERKQLLELGSQEKTLMEEIEKKHAADIQRLKDEASEIEKTRQEVTAEADETAKAAIGSKLAEQSKHHEAQAVALREELEARTGGKLRRKMATRTFPQAPTATVIAAIPDPVVADSDIQAAPENGGPKRHDLQEDIGSASTLGGGTNDADLITGGISDERNDPETGREHKRPRVESISDVVEPNLKQQRAGAWDQCNAEWESVLGFESHMNKSVRRELVAAAARICRVAAQKVDCIR